MDHLICAGETSPAASAVDLRGVSLSFKVRRGRHLEALNDITLQVREREVVAVIGPSGCGKTTLLRILAGLEMPTAGTVSVLSTDCRRASASHQIGLALQESALLPWLTCAANIALPFRAVGQPVDAERVNGLLELVGLSAYRDLRPSQLSGGMRQRASIARSLVLQPRLLLLDEPFASLDAVTRRRLNIELAGILDAANTTVVLVTHSVEEAVFLSDRVLVLSSRPGRIVHTELVTLPRPRDRCITTDAAFHRTTDRLIAVLDEAFGQGVETER